MFDKTFIEKETGIVNGVRKILSDELVEVNSQLTELSNRRTELVSNLSKYNTRLDIVQALLFFNEFMSRPFYKLLKERDELNSVVISEDLSVREYNEKKEELNKRLNQLKGQIVEACEHDFYSRYYYESDYYNGYYIYNCVFCYKVEKEQGITNSSDNYIFGMKLEELIKIYFKETFHINDINLYINKKMSP